jgi:hypothetical protein
MNLIDTLTFIFILSQRLEMFYLNVILETKKKC